MANTAPITQYRNEFILGFEQRKSTLLQSVTNEAVIKGNTATFLITSSSSNTAVTRGVNGLVPYQTEDLTQVSCTLLERHAAFRKTRFNIFQSQGDQRRSMQEASMAVINRDVDSAIITELNTATNDTGAARTGSLDLVMHAGAILGNNSASEGSITFAITPSMFAYLAQTDAFSNINIAPRKLFEGSNIMAFQWGVYDFVVHPNLPGKGTSAEKCFAYNRDAIGFALDSAGMDVQIGYDGENDHSWSRATYFGNAKLLQNSGVVVINHDGSAHAAS